ncbi:MAG TPA: AEC family transporter [Symbiobacteriaceae bacterium]|nr:AEC family transporter [Symbiobacteriaceae bacterium]
MQLLQAMINTVLPVFILAGLGWVARRVLKVEVKDPATISVYILTPALLANSILNAQMVSSEIGKIIAFALALNGAMIIITLTVGRLLGWTSVERNAAVLSAAFMNTANYGLPVILFAFGQDGFDRAAVYVVMASLLMYTVAVFFAAHGRMDWRQALKAVFKLPMVWAAAAALLVRLTGITLPEVIMKPLGLLTNGCLVILIIILGMQVAGIRLKGARFKIGVATFLRLIISPLVAMALVAFLKPEPLTGKVLILEAAMPAAVNVTLLAVQFDAEPEQVSGVTLVSTLASLATVTFWVWFLGGAA